MKCPYCGAEESKVIDSRPTEDNERIRRRRECLNCHMRFTTYEVVETVPLVVIKKDNSREPFDRQKLFNAMLRACAKRPVSYETLERAVSSIEQSLFSSYDREIPSVRIGELTMEELKKIPYVNIIGSQDPKEHNGIVNFTVEGVHPHDIASILDGAGVDVRAGHHCAQPLLKHLGVFVTTRASIAFYNDEEDIHRFTEAVKGIRRMMGYDE